MPVLEIPARDQLTLRMRRQPAFANTQQLLHLVVAHPVVLLVVEHGNQHVEMCEEIRYAHLAAQRHRVVATLSPLRRAVVEQVRFHSHGVAEGLEETTEQRFTTSAWNHREPSDERNGLRGELRTFFAASGH